MNRINIAIAEDHAMVRQGFVRMLVDHTDINILFECTNGLELLTLLENSSPQVVLLDIEMPILNGRKAIEKIKQLFPQIKIIVISAYIDDESIIQNVKLGADCFIPKHSESSTLVQSIYNVLEDGYFYEDRILALLEKNGISPHGGVKRLSSKEIAILKLICENITSEDMSKRLNIQPNTIRWYKHRIFAKTGTSDLDELRIYAQKHRYLLKA